MGQYYQLISASNISILLYMLANKWRETTAQKCWIYIFELSGHCAVLNVFLHQRALTSLVYSLVILTGSLCICRYGSAGLLLVSWSNALVQTATLFLHNSWMDGLLCSLTHGVFWFQRHYVDMYASQSYNYILLEFLQHYATCAAVYQLLDTIIQHVDRNVNGIFY